MMQRERSLKKVLWQLLVVMAFLLPVVCVAEEVVAVAGAWNKPLPKQLVNAIFGMRHGNWPDGRPVVVFVLPRQHPLHIQFCKSVLGIFPYQLHESWDRIVFSGVGEAPHEVASIEEMKEKLASVSGAIGYLPESDLSTIKPIMIVQYGSSGGAHER